LWVRFRVEVEMPMGFKAAGGLRVVPHLCGSV